MKSILDRSFQYTPAAKTDIRKTFRRVRAEQQRNATEREVKVAPIQRKVAR